jgi:DNA-binding NarL/FixJ family response regulator
MVPTAAGSVRLLLVDDHAIVRIGLRTLFKQSPGIEVVGEAANVADAVSSTIRLTPNVVLMDMRLPDGSGADACREILSACPETRVLFLTSYEDEEAVLSAVFAGAHGFLLKEIGGESLVAAVRAVAAGQSILDPVATRIVARRMQSLSSYGAAGGDDSLSAQEKRVLALVAQGQTNKEIAASLGLSDKTVKNYLSTVFQKLRVNRRAHAAAIFSRRRPK